MVERSPEADRVGWLGGAARALYFLLLLYLFFCSIELMSEAFGLAGEGFAAQLIRAASNPVAGLILGFVSTSIIQSSSTTTTIVVGLVASGALTIPVAIPIVMGANIGTTTTNTIVSLGHVTRPREFEPAFAASIVHDFFNLLSAAVLLPLEVWIHPVQRMAGLLEGAFTGAGGLALASPLQAAVGPVVDPIVAALPHEIPLVILALAMLFTALHQIVRVMRGAVLDRMAGLFDRVLFRNDAASFTLGAVMTATVQSSSATTSLIVPLAGTGVLTLKQVYPYTLGANVGTTITAILASFATGSAAAVTIAFAHLSFNLLGISIFYPLRVLPISLAKGVAAYAVRSKRHSAAVIAVYVALHIVPILFIIL